MNSATLLQREKLAAETQRAVYATRYKLALYFVIATTCIFVGAIYLRFGLRLSTPWYAEASFLGLFGSVLIKRYGDRCARLDRRLRYLDTHLSRVTGSWADEPEDVVWSESVFSDPFPGLGAFGPHSLLTFLGVTRNKGATRMLGQWLAQPASIPVARARQQTVRELSAEADLLKALGEIDLKNEVPFDAYPLIAWARVPVRTASQMIRVALGCLGTANLIFLLLSLGSHAPLWKEPIFVTAVILQLGLCGWLHTTVSATIRGAAATSREISLLSTFLRDLRNVPTDAASTPRLRELLSILQDVELLGQVRKLQRATEMLAMRERSAIYYFSFAVAWGTQCALAIDIARGRLSPRIEAAINAWSELEVFRCLATYAHYQDTYSYPALIEATPINPICLEAQGLEHPLLWGAVVDNNLRLDTRCQVALVTGANMSGKSTFLRAVGLSILLAKVGAPVRATHMSLTSLHLVAVIQVVDSLRESKSRFRAEVDALCAVVATARINPVFFLLDEILGGTNSDDRRVGTAMVINQLISSGSIGMITTHDRELSSDMRPYSGPVSVFHFACNFDGGAMTFDYKMRPGELPRTNGVELMRYLGLLPTERDICSANGTEVP